jgi:zinc protease
LRQIMTLMSEIMLSPAFPAEELEKKKKRAISGLKTVGSNADAIAGQVASVLNYGIDHPYGEVQTKENVENISIDDCKKYYDTYFRPNISYLVILGDIDVKRAKEMANTYFSTWKSKEVAVETYNPAIAPKGVRVVFVEKPGAVQSVIKVIYPLELKVGSEDASAISVMSGIFGGAFSSRLNMNLREKNAYTYGARGRVTANRYIGNFAAGASVRNEVTDSAVAQIFYEMNQMVADGVTDEELSRNINFSTGKFALALESDQTVASFALNIQKNGLPGRYYQNYLSRLQKVTKADVLKAAKKYIHPNDCYVLVVGSPDVIEGIKKFDSDGKIEFLDKNANTVSGEKKKLPEGLTAEKVIEDYVLTYTQTASIKDAQKKLKKIKTITMKSETEVQGMALEINVKKMVPNLMYNEMSMNGMVINKSVFNGKTGGNSGMQGESKMEDKEIEEMKVSAMLHSDVKLEELGYTTELKGIETINGNDAYLVMYTDKFGNIENVYFDTSSKLKVYSSQTQETEQGQSEITTEYNDYKEVGGLLFPHLMVQNVGPQLLEMKVKEIKVNEKVSKKLFIYSVD